MKTKIISDQITVAQLVSLSLEQGGAWIADIKPFSRPGDEMELKRFANPSSIPDYWKDLTRNRIAYKGKIQGFTSAAIIREQNRGMGSN